MISPSMASRAASRRVDLPVMMKRKDGVVKGLTDGVGFLFKKNKIESVRGQGRITAPDTVEVKSSDGSSRDAEERSASSSPPARRPSRSPG